MRKLGTSKQTQGDVARGGLNQSAERAHQRISGKPSCHYGLTVLPQGACGEALEMIGPFGEARMLVKFTEDEQRGVPRHLFRA